MTARITIMLVALATLSARGARAGLPEDMCREYSADVGLYLGHARDARAVVDKLNKLSMGVKIETASESTLDLFVTTTAMTLKTVRGAMSFATSWTRSVAKEFVEGFTVDSIREYFESTFIVKDMRMFGARMRQRKIPLERIQAYAKRATEHADWLHDRAEEARTEYRQHCRSGPEPIARP